MGKMGSMRKMVRAVGTISADALILAPLLIPAATAFGLVKGGTPIQSAIGTTTANLFGINLYTGAIAWPKLTAYAIGSVACVGGGIAAKRYIVKRL